MREVASLRESQRALGGANGNVCGWEGYDKYLLSETGGEEENRGGVHRRGKL